eukprot:Opistho-1_new@41814
MQAVARTLYRAVATSDAAAVTLGEMIAFLRRCGVDKWHLDRLCDFASAPAGGPKSPLVRRARSARSATGTPMGSRPGSGRPSSRLGAPQPTGAFDSDNFAQQGHANDPLTLQQFEAWISHSVDYEARLLSGQSVSSQKLTKESDIARCIFDLLDEDKSGFLELDELHELLVQWGLPVSEATDFLQAFDDGDGRIDFGEFVKFMRPVWMYAYSTILAAKKSAEERRRIDKQIDEDRRKMLAFSVSADSAPNDTIHEQPVVVALEGTAVVPSTGAPFLALPPYSSAAPAVTAPSTNAAAGDDATVGIEALAAEIIALEVPTSQAVRGASQDVVTNEALDELLEATADGALPGVVPSDG